MRVILFRTLAVAAVGTSIVMSRHWAVHAIGFAVASVLWNFDRLWQSAGDSTAGTPDPVKSTVQRPSEAPISPAAPQAYAGITLRWPDATSISKPWDGRYILVEDARHGVIWAAAAAPFPLLLRVEEQAEFEQDVRLAARLDFKRAHIDSSKCMPVTQDPRWDPIVECTVIDLGGVPVARIIERTAFGFGDERVVGRFLMPTTGGVVELQCAAHDTSTGTRTAMAALLETELGPLPSTDDAVARQRACDAPRYDRFGDALARVRTALAWMQGDGALAVTDSTPVGTRATVVLPQAGCEILPPPRFARMDTVPGVAAGLVGFARVTHTIIGAVPWNLDIWKLNGSAPERNMEVLTHGAESSTRSWAQPGSDVEIDALDITPLPPRGDYLELRAVVRFRLADNAQLALQHWLMDARDGAIWRASMSAQDGVPLETLTTALDTVMRSWRRVPDVSATTS